MVATHTKSAQLHPASTAPTLTLAELGIGQKGIVAGIGQADDTLKRRLTALGIVRGTEIKVDRTAPMGNPRTYNLLGYLLSLRNEDARTILLRLE